MSNWTDDFDSFQQSTTTASGGGGAGKGAGKKSPSRKDKIEAELKLLEWHKLANDAAIKAALMQTKQLRTSIPTKPPAHTSDDARWIRTVIEQEHIKPLEVSQQYVLDYEKKEMENMERLDLQVNRHVETLSKLRGKLQTRADLKIRSNEYREWKKEFSVKKQAVMIGKTLEEIELASNNNSNSYSRDGGDRGNPLAPYLQSAQASRGGSRELSTVLDSLNKLADLEKRITTLEKDNEYDQLISKETPAAAQRTAFEFRKKRTPLEEGAGTMGVSYALRPKKTSWNVQVPGGGGAAAVRAKQQQRKTGGGGGGGVFLTDFDDNDGVNGGGGGGGVMTAQDRMESIRRERQKQLAMASAGKKTMRSRIVSKKERSKEQAIGAKKHEEAMKELNRRRNEQQLRKREPHGSGRAPVAAPSKGAASGNRHKNKHLAEFEKIKSGHKKRKEEITQKKGGINAKFISSTAPARVAGGRAPIIKSGGTITRRTDVPVRRASGGGDVAVSGIGGLKLLRSKGER